MSEQAACAHCKVVLKHNDHEDGTRSDYWECADGCGTKFWPATMPNKNHTMQLAAISTASIQNTESTIKDRIPRENPYWTVAYSDVCAAIDREIKHRNDLKSVREMVSRFLIAHRDVARPWLESFVECGAVDIDFNYHPIYPYIKPKQ